MDLYTLQTQLVIAQTEWEDAAYEFMCSTCMADVETVRQRSLCATGRSATVTGLYWISLADTVLYWCRSNGHGTTASVGCWVGW